MSCSWEIDDRVGIDGVVGCGVVTRKVPLGGGWLLTVRLESGQVMTVDCDSVGPCAGGAVFSVQASSLCGARLPSGGTCRRRVSGGGRCFQHR
jgi:hypothetical protein